MSTRFYDTDLTDAAWAFVAPVLPAARPGGRPRTTNLRAVPCGTVYHYFQAWQNFGAWVHLHRVLYEQARRDAGRAACPSVVIMNGQSVKTTERGGARGFDAHKRVKGRKRHILVDTLGLLVANRVEPADIRSACGRSAAWRIEWVVSEDPDDNSRCRPRKPQARSNPEATPRMTATDRQETTTSVQDHGSDVDR
ncbi:MAG TPA: transposase [Chthoniobacterales bacterium]|nr:transposase [Chthoniobacterales bacterium]